MVPDVVQVKVLQSSVLYAVSADEARRIFEMKPYLSYPAFSPLAEANCFQKKHVGNGTVGWTEEIDLSPDTLYLRGEPL
jgi:hypothetical protein